MLCAYYWVWYKPRPNAVAYTDAFCRHPSPCRNNADCRDSYSLVTTCRPIVRTPVTTMHVCAIELTTSNELQMNRIDWIASGRYSDRIVADDFSTCRLSSITKRRTITLIPSVSTSRVTAASHMILLFLVMLVENCVKTLKLPPANTGQYVATSNYCKPLLFGFSCKWRFINVSDLRPLTFKVKTYISGGGSLGFLCWN